MSGFVYFIRCQDRIKIGFSKSPRKRMGKLATDAPFPCTLLGVADAEQYPEQELHAQFAHIRVHNEWFAATDELVAFINSVSFSDRPLPGHADAFQAHLKAGRGRALALAAGLHISPSAISQWQRVPVERVIEIERLTGISRHELRPDIYPTSEQESAA